VNITFISAIAIGFGAAVGAWCRWLFGLMFNYFIPNLPLGTLLVNLIGGFFMGMVLAVLSVGGLESQPYRLLITTGFLGGLTTFSAFTGESLMLLQKNEYGWALLHASSHVFGALLLAAIGFMCVMHFRA
jgi:fluoride exporter